jgi:peptidoglycan hydrolase-like amidase
MQDSIAQSFVFPSTIKVLITGRIEETREQCFDDNHPVIEVNFKEYTKNVLPNEWSPPDNFNMEALKAGAMAVKTFGWHKVVNPKYRGRTGSDGRTFHVRDTTCDQVYLPNSAVARSNSAVDETWLWIMTRDGKIFESQYLAGTQGEINIPGSPMIMSQHGSQVLALPPYDYDWPALLRYYYDTAGPIEIFPLGDINQDGIINSLDWSIMNGEWFTPGLQADLNGDGFVNSVDFSIMNTNWGITK